MRKLTTILIGLLFVSSVVMGQHYTNIIDDQTFYTHENVVNNELIGDIMGYPFDTLTNVSYTILSGNGTGKYSINSSGELLVNDDALFDYATDNTDTLSVSLSCTSGSDIFNVYINILNPANTVYIDRGAAGGGNGSYSTPYDNLTSGINTSDVNLLFNRGYSYTRYSISYLDNVYWGAYGTGNKPTFNVSFGNRYVQYSDNIYLDNLHFIAISNQKTLDIIYDNTLTVNKCILEGDPNESYGIGIVGGGTLINITVNYTEIFNFKEDGVYLSNLDTALFLNNYIHDVNLSSLPGSQGHGDGYQLRGSEQTTIRGNYIDRSNGYGKFCIITELETIDFIVENNYLVGAQSGWGGAGVYLKAGNNPQGYQYVRNNYLIGPRANTGIWWEGDMEATVIVSNNIIAHWGKAFSYNTVPDYKHNTFYNNDYVVGPRLQNCLIYQFTGQQVFVNNQSGSYADNMVNFIDQSIENTTGFIEGTFEFVDATNLDFRLLSGSDAIDAADTWYIDTDINGVTRTYPYDFGAYKYLGDLGWCDTNKITQSGLIGEDTIPRNTGYVNVTPLGGVGTLVYDWSSGESTQDISNKQYGSYTLTITDDSLCVSIATYPIPQVDTSTPESQLQYLSIDTVYSNFEDGANVAVNILDNDFDTRLSNNQIPAIVTIVLDSVSRIDSLLMALYKGDERVLDFDAYVSQDSLNWVLVFSGSSSGNTLDYEYYNVTDAVGKYIKIEGYGNDDPVSEDWTSITEFRALGDTTSGCILINIDADVTNTTEGASDGAIDVTATGGSGTLSYLWTPGNTTSQDTSGLSQDTYYLTVTDTSNCTASDSWTIYTKVSVGGGSSTFFTDWENFTDGDNISDSANYSDIANDWVINNNGGNLIAESASVANSALRIDKSLSTTDSVSVKLEYNYRTGAYNGIMFLESDTNGYGYVFRSDASYVFSWGAVQGRTTIGNNGGSTFDGDDLMVTYNNDTLYCYRNGSLSTVGINSDGKHKVSFTPTYAALYTNSNNAQFDTINIYGIQAATIYLYPIDATVEQVNIDCYGEATGALTVTPFNGVEPITHSWSNDSTDNSLTNLIPGVYHDTLVDAVDSTAIKTYTIAENDSIYYEIFVYDAVDSSDNGHINIFNISGGSGSYAIEWDDGSSASSRLSLFPGEYWFIITDGLGCTTDTVNVTVSDGECNVITLTPTILDAPLGSITLDIDPPTILDVIEYTYLWSNGETTKDIDSLDAGTYSVIVTEVYTSCQAFGSYQVANIPTIRRAAVINTGGKVRLNQNGKIITQ